MKLSAVLLARALGFIETFDLTPRGGVFYPDLVKAIVERYRFQRFPQKVEEFDEQKGVEFWSGEVNGQVIDKLVIYNSGILIDTRTDTQTSRALIEDALLWAKSRFEINYEPGTIRRFGYVSQVTFHSDMTLDGLNPALQRLSDRLSEAVSGIHGHSVRYQTSSIQVHHDPLARKNPIAGFTIFPRVDTPFSEKKYFSEAPVPTDVHIALLEEFERDILRHG
jgi:hypothetical protein